MTPLKQQISLIQFSIEHSYNRRRFENRSDQTFCILLINDVSSAIESANLRRRQNLIQKWSGFEFVLIWIRMSVEYPFPNFGYIRRRHSFRQVWLKSAVDCMRTKKTDVVKWPIPQWRRKWKTGIHAQIRINYFYRVTSYPCMPSLVDVRFRVRQLSCLQNDRTNERMTENDHITSALLT